MRGILASREKETLASEMVCDIISENCAYRKCNNCNGRNSIHANNVTADIVKFCRWERSDDGDHITTKLVEVHFLKLSCFGILINMYSFLLET